MIIEPRSEIRQNRAVQPQKMARGLKFRIYKEEGLSYPYSQNKGADQLRGHREADLRLRFRICKKPVFSKRGSYVSLHLQFCMQGIQRRMVLVVISSFPNF